MHAGTVVNAEGARSDEREMLFDEQWGEPYATRPDRKINYCQVHIAAQQIPHQLRRVRGVSRQRHARNSSYRLLNQRAECRRVSKRRESKRDWRFMGLHKSPNQRYGAAALLQGAPCLANEEMSGPGDAYASCAAFEELGSERGLDLTDPS